MLGVCRGAWQPLGLGRAGVRSKEVLQRVLASGQIMRGCWAGGPALLGEIGADWAFRMLFWGLVLLTLCVVSGLVLLWLRRRMAKADNSSLVSFSIEALEDMRASGQLSEEEFRRLRRTVLPLGMQEMAQQAEKADNCTLSPPSDGDDEERGHV